jgi:ABC-type multidrug transport system fused ATPase/permease subunit
MANVAQAFTGPNDLEGHFDMKTQMNFIASYVSIIASTLFVFCYLFFALWQHLAENITTDLRKRYLAALMKQEIAYFEVN